MAKLMAIFCWEIQITRVPSSWTPVLKWKLNGEASIGARGAECPLTVKKLSKNRKKREQIRKKRKNREEKVKIRKVLSLCPSWQIGLARLLKCPPPHTIIWCRLVYCMGMYNELPFSRNRSQPSQALTMTPRQWHSRAFPGGGRPKWATD